MAKDEYSSVGNLNAMGDGDVIRRGDAKDGGQTGRGMLDQPLPTAVFAPGNQGEQPVRSKLRNSLLRNARR